MSDPSTAAHAIRLDEEGRLRCPSCGETYTHVDNAYVTARREDAESNQIRANGITGEVQTHRTVPAPADPQLGGGRRHRIATAGWCETCGHEFAIVFTQHKGETFVGVTKAPEPVDTRDD